MSIPAPPGFTVNPVRNRTAGGLVGADTLGLILHVQAGDGELTSWFNNPDAQASSTWWGGKLGGRSQYGNPDTDKFWAQAAGNPTYHSIETEGQPNQPLTAAQIETVAVAYAWGHTRYGWPFRLAEKPGDPGLGWHGMGGKAWGGHTGCPGDLRKAQRPQILARAQQIAGDTTTPQEDDMTPDEARDAVLKADIIPSPVATGAGNVTPVTALKWAMEWSLAARNAAQEALAIAKAQAAKGGPLTAAEIEDAMKDALAGGIQINVTATTKES